MPESGAWLPKANGANGDRAEDLVHQAELDLAEALAAELGRQVRGPQPALLDLLLQRRDSAVEAVLVELAEDRLDRPDLRAHEVAHPVELRWNSGSVEKSHAIAFRRVTRDDACSRSPPAVAVIAGAALQSSVGFGFALVAAPLLFAAASPAEAVGLMIVLGLEIEPADAADRAPPARSPSGATSTAVVAWSLPGALAGVAVLRALDELALQLLVTAGVLAALVVNLRAARRPPPPPGAAHEPPRWARPAAGLASGALNTSTSTGGPPVVLLLMSRGLRPGVVRDTLTASFVGFARRQRRGAAARRARGDAVPDAAALAALIPLTALGHLAAGRCSPASRRGAPTSACSPPCCSRPSPPGCSACCSRADRAV